MEIFEPLIDVKAYNYWPIFKKFSKKAIPSIIVAIIQMQIRVVNLIFIGSIDIRILAGVGLGTM